MAKYLSTSATVCIAALFAGSAAHADVSAQEVWENWKAQIDIYGEDGFTYASEEYSGGTLTVSDIQISMSDEFSTFRGDLGSLVFTENGDGTVTIDIPKEMSMVIGSSEKSSGDRVVVNISNSGTSAIASGDPDAINYQISSDRYTVEIAEAFEDGEAIDMELRANVNDLDFEQTVTNEGELRDISFAGSAASFDLFLSVLEDDENVDISGQTLGVAFSGNSVTPIDYDATRPELIFQAGGGAQMQYSSVQTGYLLNVTDDMGTTSIATSATDVNAEFSIDMDHMAISFDESNVAISASGGQVPFPIDASIAHLGMNLEMPMSMTDEPADFALGFDVTDFAMNDMIWMMADPAGMLPRDPATILVDFTGTAKLFADLFDPAQTAKLDMDEAPGELHSITLNGLNLSVAGASITGDGGFTFDNTDLESFDGIPRPEGEVNLEAKGINGLMDTLVEMGLIPEDQIMGARFMLGMFANSVGDDHLSSKLEVNSEGHVLANGQRLQ